MLYFDSDFVTFFRATAVKVLYHSRQLALVRVMQFVEGLTERQASEAIRSNVLIGNMLIRIKITDNGFDHLIFKRI